MKKILPILLVLLTTSSLQSFAQMSCTSLLTDEYISDGQYYSTTISATDTKECDITLTAGNEYRIIVCAQQLSRINFQVIDTQNNILFNNKKYNYTNYWNFHIKETFNGKIKLQLVDNNVETDEIILLIGYKK